MTKLFRNLTRWKFPNPPPKSHPLFQLQHDTKITVDGVSIDVKIFDVQATLVIGTNTNPAFTPTTQPVNRGAVIALLKDGTVVMGGGKSGGLIYVLNQKKNMFRLIGNIIPRNERIEGDARFAITDIGVLSEKKHMVNLLISYPRLVSNCVELVVYQVTYNRNNGSLTKKDMWFKSSPPVPLWLSKQTGGESVSQFKPAAVQNASGRIEVIDELSAYLTVGDLGFNQIADSTKIGTLSGVFQISKTNVNRLSKGHRNMLGITVMNGKDILVSEMGPSGGDEINLIKPGGNYGWPHVSYGTPYSDNDYVIPKKFGTHEGYTEPIIHWSKSIAPTELSQIPKGRFGKYSSGIVMGTLREQALVFLRFENNKIVESEIVKVGARIRDLEVLSDKRLIASTDDGKLMIFSSPETPETEILHYCLFLPEYPPPDYIPTAVSFRYTLESSQTQASSFFRIRTLTNSDCTRIKNTYIMFKGFRTPNDKDSNHVQGSKIVRDLKRMYLEEYQITKIDDNGKNIGALSGQLHYQDEGTGTTTTVPRLIFPITDATGVWSKYKGGHIDWTYDNTGNYLRTLILYPPSL